MAYRDTHTVNDDTHQYGNAGNGMPEEEGTISIQFTVCLSRD